MKKTLLSLALSAVLLSAQAQHTIVLARIDTLLNNLDADRNINGNVLVATHGQPLFEHSYGWANSEIKNNADTRFVMASVSKPFTAVAIFQLIEKNKLALDRPVQSYLRSFPYPGITIRHLLSHSSGLPNTEELFTPLWQSDTSRQFSNKDLLPALTNHRSLHFQPGEKFEYSNTNYSLLALLVEQQSGQPFATYMAKHLFRPAGMTHTAILSPNQEYGPNDAHKYDRPLHYTDTLRSIESIAALRKFTYNWVGFQGPGNMISTLRDMLAFDQALYAGKLVSSKSQELMFTPHRLNDGSIPYRRSGIDEAAYGLGWYIFRDTTRGKVVWHSGGVPGMNTFLLRNLGQRELIVTTDNAQNGPIAPELYILLSEKPFYRPRSLARLYVTTLLQHGSDQAAAMLGTHRNDRNFGLSEGELNFLGIELMESQHLKEALEVFKINTLLFPNSFNVFDSYGEALVKAGQKAAAILMYQKAVALNPKHEAGKKILAGLLQ